MTLDGATELYRARRLGGLQAPTERAALVVVDLTHAFTDPESAMSCDAEAAVQETVRLLRTARTCGAPVVFTRIAYTAAGAALAAPFVEKMPALAESTIGSRYAEIDGRVAPMAHEPVLTKLFASGFFGTDLATFLAVSRCDGVVITGASTSGCVRATVVDAVQHGYRVRVPAAAVADRARAPHEAALFDIQAKYGHVVTTDEAERCLIGADNRADHISEGVRS